MNNQTPLVSINCLVYNHELYLRDCFEGFVIQKTNFVFEILVHDDASTDHSADIIREYTMKYPELFRPIFQTENQYSKGKGFVGLDINNRRAKGIYIALCEGDDYWIDPYKLQKQVDFLEKNPDYGLVYTNYQIIDQSLKIKKAIDTNKCFSGNVLNKLIEYNFIATLTVCFRSSVLTNVDFKETSTFLMGDYPMWLQIAKVSMIHYMSDVTAVYRSLNESACHSTSFEKNESFWLSNLTIQLYYLKKFKIEDISEEKIKETNYTTLLNFSLSYRNYSKSREYADMLPLNNTAVILKYFITRNKFVFNVIIEIIRVGFRIIKKAKGLC